jgi:predicted permease
MRTLLQNIRFALRQWRQSPGFVAMAVLTLAMGIGGATAIFTLIDAVTFRQLPVSHPERLYRVGNGSNCCVDSGPQEPWGLFSFALFYRLKREMPEFEEVTAFQAFTQSRGVRREGGETAPRPLRSEYVSGNYFSTLGVRAFDGRTFTPTDDRADAPPVMVLSHHAWQTMYGADPAVVGSTFVVEGHPFTVIGVAPPGFFGETPSPNPPELWIPLQQELTISEGRSLLLQSNVAWLRVIGRLRPEASIAGMAPRLTASLQQWVQHDAGYAANIMPDVTRMLPRLALDVVPAGAGIAVLKEQSEGSLRLLLCICGLVLLIACANVANLLLARAASRHGQTALRLAVGATRLRIVAQATTESLLLALAGGIAGLGIAIVGVKLMLASRSAPFLPIGTTPSINVLAFTFGLVLLSGIVSGTSPAWLATRSDPAQVLRGTGRNSNYHSGFATKSLLVVQAMLSVVLVADAALLARSVHKLETQDLGYPTEGRVLATLNSPPASYSLPRLTALYRQIDERLHRLPGVQGTGLAMYNPLTAAWRSLIVVAGHPAPKLAMEETAAWDRVSADYLQNLGVTVVRGRGFSTADPETSEPVALVNQAFARQFFKKGEDPLDGHFGLYSPPKYRVVGIVKDAKFVDWSLWQAAPMCFVLLGQHVEFEDEEPKSVEARSHFISGIMLVTKMSPGVLEPLLRKALAEVDSSLTITTVMTMQQQVEASFDQERTVAALANLFGTIALLLAAVGLYAVTTYSVAQRTGEIGVRMALGARRAEVLRFVLRGAFRRVVAGLLLGLPLAVAAGYLISSGLYGVRPWDPLALAVAAGSLAFSAFVAAIVPAGRAAAIEPMEALRME